MRFRGTCYRSHDPRWAFKPISGEGAASRGARFNPKGVPALYLACSIVTAIKEVTQGFGHKLDPTVLCAYEVDCGDVVDLTSAAGLSEAGTSLEEMGHAWVVALADGRRPASWSIHDRLRPTGAAGILVPSFAPGADASDRNLVLWDWGPELPHKVEVFDPSGRLPKNQLSWD